MLNWDHLKLIGYVFLYTQVNEPTFVRWNHVLEGLCLALASFLKGNHYYLVCFYYNTIKSAIRWVEGNRTEENDTEMIRKLKRHLWVHSQLTSRNANKNEERTLPQQTNREDGRGEEEGKRDSGRMKLKVKYFHNKKALGLYRKNVIFCFPKQKIKASGKYSFYAIRKLYVQCNSFFFKLFFSNHLIKTKL